jgi:hypothetical protein
VKLGNNESDTYAVLSEACGGEARKKSSVFQWHKQLKKGHESVEDDERNGCPRSHRSNGNVEENTESGAFTLRSKHQPSLLCGSNKAVT